LANATKEAIAFEREMIKISQVTGKTMSELKGLENTITNLATSLGVSSKSILSVGRILAQAGIQAGDLKVALTALAKTELAPTFDDITKTAEGAVAVLAQFGEGVGALERQLGAINRVAGQFAVESGDLISVIRRTGGVFKAAGGDLNELIALFTSVRATTRESAESIATGLRTIFTRIQRPKTIEFLKQFGVELTDLNGKFVGPFEAIKQLSAAKPHWRVETV
jgi:TP901 family phage tail tape measure protein